MLARGVGVDFPVRDLHQERDRGRCAVGGVGGGEVAPGAAREALADLDDAQTAIETIRWDKNSQNRTK